MAPEGAERTDEFTVEGRLLTDVGGTIPVKVLSTPGMIGMMERCAAMLALQHLPDGQATVGFEVCIKHVGAAAEGAQCTVTAKLREVGPRDGFQNEPEVIATDDKVALVDCLARTGVKRLEVTSFVRADVIPQLADAREVLTAAQPPEDVALSVLVPNERGLDNALEVRDTFDEV